MTHFGRNDLGQMIAGLRPAHYEDIDTTPLLALLYEQVADRIRNTYGVTQFRTQSYVTIHDSASGRSAAANPPARCVFKWGKHGSALELTLFEAGNGMYDSGIVIDSQSDDAEDRIMRWIREAVGRYNSETIWSEAVGKRLCAETAEEYAKKDTDRQRGLNLRFVHVYQPLGVIRTRGMWAFDGEVYLYGPQMEGSVLPSTDLASMILTIGNTPRSWLAEVPMIAAMSEGPLFSWDYQQVGLLVPGFTARVKNSTTYMFYADRSREEAMLRAFDSMAAQKPLQVCLDRRKK